LLTTLVLLAALLLPLFDSVCDQRVADVFRS